VSPLFLESALKKELSAVQSEDDGYYYSDDHRIIRILEDIASPSHPYSRPDAGEQNCLFLTCAVFNIYNIIYLPNRTINQSISLYIILYTQRKLVVILIDQFDLKLFR